jgi:activator of 2-hydroxyglutaryl-CoA dehydratase
MKSEPAYAGVDVGASRTKVAILDANKNLIGHAVKKSGTDFAATADACLTLALKMAGTKKSEKPKSGATQRGVFTIFPWQPPLLISVVKTTKSSKSIRPANEPDLK